MQTTDDPEAMTPQERFAEVTAILAAGFLRLNRRTVCLPAGQTEAADMPEIPPCSAVKDSPKVPQN